MQEIGTRWWVCLGVPRKLLLTVNGKAVVEIPGGQCAGRGVVETKYGRFPNEGTARACLRHLICTAYHVSEDNGLAWRNCSNFYRRLLSQEEKLVVPEFVDIVKCVSKLEENQDGRSEMLFCGRKAKMFVVHPTDYNDPESKFAVFNCIFYRDEAQGLTLEAARAFAEKAAADMLAKANKDLVGAGLILAGNKPGTLF